MNVQHLTNPQAPIRDLLEAAAGEGLLVESESHAPYAILPLDDELIDFLLERSPSLIEECRQIRERMRGGRFRSHAEVRAALDETADPA
jgi:hypothetical protein